MDFLPIIEGLIAQYPIAVKALAFIGLCRVIVKPIIVGVKAYVAASETKKDDELVSQVEANPIYKGFVFVCDLIFSVKLPVK